MRLESGLLAARRGGKTVAKKTGGNKKRARGKSTLKDLDVATGKAKGVKGGVKAGSGPLARAPYTPR
jgi:hypothetical protein